RPDPHRPDEHERDGPADRSGRVAYCSCAGASGALGTLGALGARGASCSEASAVSVPFALRTVMEPRLVASTTRGPSPTLPFKLAPGPEVSALNTSPRSFVISPRSVVAVRSNLDF